MKFNLKKIFGFAFVILLIWSVYNMFFGKIIEGVETEDDRCKKLTAQGPDVCWKSRCEWVNAKPAQPYIAKGVGGRRYAQPAKPAQPAQCRY